MRIKEILKEQGRTLNWLADELGVSRQALSRQVGGKLLVETAEKIASVLNVPLWQLFEDPSSVCPDVCPKCGYHLKEHVEGDKTQEDEAQ